MDPETVVFAADITLLGVETKVMVAKENGFISLKTVMTYLEHEMDRLEAAWTKVVHKVRTEDDLFENITENNLHE